MKVWAIVTKYDEDRVVYTNDYGYCFFPEENAADCAALMNQLENKESYKMVLKDMRWRNL